ncbi:MAG: hypothetical protein K0S07_220 [Chlamydiales bacterium]|jgi:hypothetical protein|nr:hypothetical protein [Chlamydiales bacterium]
MQATNFADNPILKMVPLLTPAIHKDPGMGTWTNNLTLSNRRIAVVALAAIAAGVATVAVALFTASPLIIPVGVLAISALVYTILSVDSHRAEKAIETRNVEDFCRLESPSYFLLDCIASKLDLIQRVVALKGDLNKTSALRDSLLKSAMEQDAKEVPPSFKRVHYLLDHGASPLKGEALLKAIREEKYHDLLPLFLGAIQENEVVLFKKHPHQLENLLNKLIRDSRKPRPLSDEIIFMIFADLKISLSDLQAVPLLSGNIDMLNLFADYLSEEKKVCPPGQGNLLKVRLEEMESKD